MDNRKHSDYRGELKMSKEIISEYSTDISRGSMVNYEEMKTKYQITYGRTGFLLEPHHQKDLIEKFLFVRFDNNLQYLWSKKEYWEYLPKVDGWRFVPRASLKNDIIAFAHFGIMFYDEQNPNEMKSWNPTRGLSNFRYFLQIKVYTNEYLRRMKNEE